MKMNFSLVCLFLLCTGCVTHGAPPPAFAGATPLEWSRRLADSTMARETKPPKWDYAMGLFTLSVLKLNEVVGQASSQPVAGKMPAPPNYVKFAEDKVGSLISPDGKIQGYQREEFQLDALNPGKTVLALLQITHEPRYAGCVIQLCQQPHVQPRTADGGFWHKQRYTNQMWLDGIYMAMPFYAGFGEAWHSGKLSQPAGADPGELARQASNRIFDEVARQIHLIDEHTYDAKSGLNYHGWDAAKIQPWANPVTGCSSNFWGRAEGWYDMALVDVLDYFPTNHPARAQIVATLQKTARGIVKWQDAQSGLWWQVMDAGDRKGNYQEATASSMFVYALAKGVNRGYLPRDYVPAIEKGYAGIVKNLLRDDGNGNWSLTQCCQVAGLGFTNAAGRPRDGSFDYYVSEPVVSNDLKGVGPFILAGIEMQRLGNNP